MADHPSGTESTPNPFPISSLDDLIGPFVVPPAEKISLTNDYDPGFKAHYLEKTDAENDLQQAIQALATYQDMLYAQGCQVHNFKTPSTEELDHGFLWRCAKVLPRRGQICIFNRSYYEDVLVTRVHPELHQSRQLPPELLDGEIWERRYSEINAFEDYLVNNGTIVLKFFLNVSKQEQKERLLERVDRPEKNWKYSIKDAIERTYWDDYMSAYEAMVNRTSTVLAPWHVISADHKWFTRLAVAAAIYIKLKSMNLSYPSLSSQQRADLPQAKSMIEQQD